MSSLNLGSFLVSVLKKHHIPVTLRNLSSSFSVWLLEESSGETVPVVGMWHWGPPVSNQQGLHPVWLRVVAVVLNVAPVA